jgi:exonuclease SbcC
MGGPKALHKIPCVSLGCKEGIALNLYSARIICPRFWWLSVIKRIRLKNWKTHKTTTMEFAKGINVIIGVMGAGKSSIMDAISFALFGTFPALFHHRVGLSDLVMSRPTIEDSTEIALDFEVQGSLYNVTRKFSSAAGSSARLEKDGKYLQTQPERVNEEIAKLLGIDYDTFSRVVYAEQNRLDYFLELRKGDRKKQVDQMLGLDRFSSAEENSTSLINSIKQLVTDEESMLTNIDFKRLQKELEELNATKDKISRSLADLIANEKEAEGGVASAKKEVAEMRESYAKKLAISNEISQLASKISTLGEEIEKIKRLDIDRHSILKEKEAVQEEEKKRSVELESAKKEEMRIIKESADAESKIKLAKNRRTERDKILAQVGDKTLEGIDTQLKESSSAVETLLSSLSAAKSRSAELRDTLKELEEHVGKCPVCERELGKELRKTLLLSKKKEIDALSEESLKIERKLANAKKGLKELEGGKESLSISFKLLKGYDGVDEELASLSAKLPSLKEAMAEAMVKTQKVRDLLESSNRKLNEIKLMEDTLKRMEDYQKNVDSCNSAVAALKKSISTISVDEKSLYRAQEELSAKEAKLSGMKSEIEGERKLLQSVLPQIDSKSKDIQNFGRMKERIDRRREVLLHMGRFKTALVETEALLRNRLISSINTVMDSLWPKLYPYSDYTRVRLSARKDDYVLEADTGMDGDRKWVEVDSVASGGERSIACLTMRMAFAMVVVPNLRWLILDEPTHNLDAKGISSLVTVLGENLPVVVEQIFIITHEEQLRQINLAKVFVLERDKGLGEPTQVSEL